jgi:hypothetical protein
MNKKFLKLTGRVVSVNAADQSVLIESTESPNRLRVYAVNKLFRQIDPLLTRAWFNGKKAREITGSFYIQGKVLIGFEIRSKPIEKELWLEVDEAFHSALDFFRQIGRPGQSK